MPTQGGEVIEDGEGIITGEIRSQIGGRLTSSPFECQVGDIVILEEKEQLVGGPGKDISVFCVLHLKKYEVGEDTA